MQCARNCTDRTHSRESGPETKRHTQEYVSRRAGVLPTLYQSNGFMTEG